MQLKSLLTLALTAVRAATFVLPAEANMVARQIMMPDGTVATVHVNRGIPFVHTPRTEDTSKVSKRVTFQPGNDDYCSETAYTLTYGSDAPLVADCTAIKQYVETVTGFYTVSPSDFDASTRWATVVSSGTCRFAIQFQLVADTKTVVIGTNDVHFYTQYAIRYPKNGKVKCTGAISCYNNGTMNILNWGMIHV